MSEPSRRTICVGLAAVGLTGALPTRSAAALTEGEARVLVDRVVSDINRVIDSGKSLNRIIADFERLLARYADVNIIARSALGPAARQASSAQLDAFTRAFRGYIARKYGKRFREFKNGRIDVKAVRRVKSWYEVRSMAHIPGEAPFDVRFLVSDRSGSDKFFDIFIEGVSLRLTERTEIGALLDQNRGNIDGLIADLRRAG